MLSILLQIQTATDSVTNAAATGAGEQPGLSLLDLIFKGGWVMIPLFLLSFITIYVIVERYLAIKNASTNPEPFMGTIKSQIIKGDLQGAQLLCHQTKTPIARMIEKGIRRIGSPLKDIETAIENVGKVEVAKLEKNINILGIIAGIAPMLGFIGTIIGVIQIFYSISVTNDFGIAQISGGLYTKMVTSAAGLIVGILAHVGYHYLSIMVDRVVLKIEHNAIDFIDLLQEN
jgi:biopolymer transport protein ExbB